MVGVVSPAMIHASVDFPEPLPPWISTPSPSLTVKLTSRRALFAQGVPLPYTWPTPSNCSTGTPLSGAAWGVGTALGAGGAALPTITMLSTESLRFTTRSAISASLL